MSAGRMVRRDDSGMTLLELLMSLSLTLIIVGSITTALTTFFQIGSSGLDRDERSAAALLFNTYLNRDLSSADSQIVPATSECLSAGESTLLKLAWQEYAADQDDIEPAANGTAFRSLYLLAPDPLTEVDNDCRVVRRYQKQPPGDVTWTTVDEANLSGGFASGSVIINPATSATPCAEGTPMRILLQGSDEGASPFVVTGCLLTRQDQS